VLVTSPLARRLRWLGRFNSWCCFDALVWNATRSCCVDTIARHYTPCSVGSGDIAIPSDSTARLSPKDSPGAAVGCAPSVDPGDIASLSDSAGGLLQP
jgi:hypothetical protein